MNKKENKNLFIWIGIWVFTLIVLLLLVKIFSSWNIKLPESEPKKLTSILVEKWDYKIWIAWETYDICHNSSGCLIGEILNMKKEWDGIYMFYDFDFDKDTKWYWDEETMEYRYCRYSNNDCSLVDDLNLIPELLILKNWKLTMYNKKELANLDVKSKQIFKELEEWYALKKTNNDSIIDKDNSTTWTWTLKINTASWSIKWITGSWIIKNLNTNTWAIKHLNTSTWSNTKSWSTKTSTWTKL